MTDFTGVTIEKSPTMAGNDNAWISAFTSDDWQAVVHMDSGSVGDYLVLNWKPFLLYLFFVESMTFPSAQTFNGFRFECGGNNDNRQIEMNVFEVQYHDGSNWVTVATTDSANLICEPTDSSGYATWDAQYTSTRWRFVLTGTSYLVDW